MNANVNTNNVKSSVTILDISNFKLHAQFEKFSKILAVIAVFLIPISTSLLNITLVLLIICWLLSGHLKEKLSYSLQHPIGRASLLLFSLFIMGCFYAHGPLTDSMSLLLKMSKLLCIIIFLPLMREKKWRNYCCAAFVSSMLFSLILGMGKQYLGLPFYLSHASPATVFKSYIDTNLMMALSAFILAHSLYLSIPKKIKYLIGCVIVMMMLYVLWLSEGRSGYFVFMALWILFCIQRLTWKQCVLGFSALLLLLGVAAGYSPKFQNRLSVLPQQIQQYQGGELNSVAERIDYFRHTYTLAQKKVWLGWGTGSLKKIYGDYAKENHLKATNNPHNEYLNVFFHLGVVGLIVFLSFLWTILKTTYRLPNFERNVLQGILTAFMLGCLANSWLMDFTSGYLFVILTAICSAALTYTYNENPRDIRRS